MKTINPLLLAISIPLFAGSVFGQLQVLVIESQSVVLGQDQDMEWLQVAGGAGYSTVLGAQADLQNDAFYSTTDVLVVASGTIPLSPQAWTSIGDFLAQGGRVYLQGEWQSTLSSNQLFASLVAANGGTFAWTNQLIGDLQPVTPSAPLDGPLSVPPLNHFHYGVTGVGTGVNVAMQDGLGNDVGWTLENANGGRLVHNCDQDWIRTATSEDYVLMENMLSWLSEGIGGGPASYCAPAAANSIAASGAVLTSTGGFGTASATFMIADIPSQPGLLFMGPNMIDIPFGCGRRCVGGTAIRGPVLNPVGNSIGTTFDMSALTSMNIQYWYMDPANFASCGDSFNLSNAVMP